MLIALVALPLVKSAQGVIGGKQNARGQGGYMPVADTNRHQQNGRRHRGGQQQPHFAGLRV